MNESTEGVTIQTGFVFEVLAEYSSARKLCAPAFALADQLDPARLDAWCDITLFNDVCGWIEEHVGASSIRRTGTAVGGRLYGQGLDAAAAEPLAVMEAVSGAARTLIRDPEGRGFEIRSHLPKRIEIRRTQTFNCVLQEGVLLALVERTGVVMPSVRQIRCTRHNHEYCEYEVRWLRDARRSSRALHHHDTGFTSE